MSAYIIDGRRCPSCLYRRDEFRHLKRCVPQKFWPPEEEWRDNQPQPVRLPQRIGAYPRSTYEQAFPRAGSVTDRPLEVASIPRWVAPVLQADEDGAAALAFIDTSKNVVSPNLTIRTECECGWRVPDGKDIKAALRMHRMKAKAHAQG